MNDAHLHLIINHFPIVGMIIGVSILASGFLFKSSDVRKTGLVILVISSLATFAAVYTGEGAEDMVEEIVGNEDYIHRHEETAERFALISYAAGILALAAFVSILKNHKMGRILSVAALIVATIAAAMSKEVGTTGGEIRHTEIRENGFINADADNDHHEEIEKADDDDDDGKGRGRKRKGRNRD